MRVLCLWFPGWPIQRLAAARPELKQRPLVLYETQRGSQRVSACCGRAGGARIVPGMPLAEATALAGPERIVVEAHDRLHDRQRLGELAIECGRFSPLVGIEDGPQPESLFLDITGIGELFGGEMPLATAVQSELAQQGFEARLAAADTLGAAWAAAHFEPAGHRIRLIPPGKVLDALRPLPVAALRLLPETLDLLYQLGLYRIAQLETLPRQDLAARFGSALVERLDQASGRLIEPVQAIPLPSEFEASHTLEHPSARREAIEAVLESLVESVAGQLARSGRGALRLECRLEEELGPCTELSVGLFRPMASPRHLLGLVRMQLDRVVLRSPVESVHLRAPVSDRLERRQHELFGERRGRENPRELAALIDRLSSRLGPRGVLRPCLQPDAQPEWAYRYQPLVETTGRPRRRRGAAGALVAADTPPPRPLWLLRRPLPLAAMSVQPDGPPVRFRFQSQDHPIAAASGPERIETGWWRGRTVRRDYYRVETAGGQRFWLFRRLPDGQWFLHGTFD